MAQIPHVEPLGRVRAAQQNVLIDQVNENTQDITELKSGGTPQLDPVVDWFTGEGPPPAVITGAGAGDMYVDTLTGQLYQLR